MEKRWWTAWLWQEQREKEGASSAGNEFLAGKEAQLCSFPSGWACACASGLLRRQYAFLLTPSQAAYPLFPASQNDAQHSRLPVCSEETSGAP